MKCTGILICLGACAAALVTFFTFYNAEEGKILLVKDSVDPMGEIIELPARNSIEYLTSHQLGFYISA